MSAELAALAVGFSPPGGGARSLQSEAGPKPRSPQRNCSSSWSACRCSRNAP